MNPGEVWALEDSTTRMVVSHGTYNASDLHRVITVVVGQGPNGFDPFAVPTELGTVYADRIAMHPHHWLKHRIGRVDDNAYAAVRKHIQFLLMPAR